MPRGTSQRSTPTVRANQRARALRRSGPSAGSVHGLGLPADRRCDEPVHAQPPRPQRGRGVAPGLTRVTVLARRGRRWARSSSRRARSTSIHDDRRARRRFGPGRAGRCDRRGPLPASRSRSSNGSAASAATSPRSGSRGSPGTATSRPSRPAASGGSSRSAPRRWAPRCPRASRLSYELDSEGFKLVADRLVEEAGIHPMLHRSVRRADRRRRPRSPASSPSRRPVARRSLARVVIDATGDADVAFRAGAPDRHDAGRAHAGGLGDVPPRRRRQARVPRGRARPTRRPTPTGSSGEWQIETSGKEDAMFSPYLGKPFEQAIRDGRDPARPDDHRRHLGCRPRHRRADLHEPRPPRRRATAPTPTA